MTTATDISPTRRAWARTPPCRVGHPLVTLLAVAARCASVHHIIECTPRGWVGRRLHAPSGPFSREPLSRTFTLSEDSTLEASTPAWTVTDFDVTSASYAFPLEFTPSVMYTGTLEVHVETRGWLSATRLSTLSGPVFHPLSKPNPDPTRDIPALREALGAYLERNRETEAAAHVRAGAVHATRILWRGYAMNALFLVSVPLTLLSLYRFTDWRYARRVRRGFARNACPGCGYSLVGVPASEGLIICPECGDYSQLDA